MMAPNVILFPVKVTFFQIVILNARLEFAFSPPLCALGSGTALIYDELYIDLDDVKEQTFAQ